MAATTSLPLLDTPYPLTADHRTRFREDGFVRLPGVFDEPTLAEFDREITRLTMEHNPVRKVHTVIYMDADMRLAEPRNANQRADHEAWTPSTAVGEVMNDPLNPVLFEA